MSYLDTEKLVADTYNKINKNYVKHLKREDQDFELIRGGLLPALPVIAGVLAPIVVGLVTDVVSSRIKDLIVPQKTGGSLKVPGVRNYKKEISLAEALGRPEPNKEESFIDVMNGEKEEGGALLGLPASMSGEGGAQLGPIPKKRGRKSKMGSGQEAYKIGGIMPAAEVLQSPKVENVKVPPSKALKKRETKQNMPASSFSGGAKKPNKRAEIVKQVMKERGVSLIEASKIVKNEGLYKK